MKKIVFVFRNMGTGGAQKIEAFVANAMYEEGHEVIVINMASSPCTVDINSNIRVIDVLYDEIEKCENKILSIIYKFIYLYKLRTAILEINPDLICGFLSDVVRIIVIAMKGCSIPIIGSERGDPFTFTEKQFLNYKSAYMKCKGVVFQLDDVKKKYGLPSEVVQKVIPNPCIPRKGKNFSKGNDDKKIIIGAGRLSPQKRFDLLVEAFDEIYRDYPDYRLHIYGNGPLYEMLSAKIDTLPSRKAISLIGDVKDVFNEKLEAQFFVLTSDFEGIPNVLIEAMAAKIPCIATDCSPGGARFLLKNGECGLIVKRDNKEELVAAIKKYIDDEALREKMKEKGYETIHEFNPKLIREMWIDIFNQCM